MFRLAKALTFKLWQLFLLLVVLTGILIGTARIVAPELSEYRNQAVVWAEEALGQPVKISGMTMRWRGFGPQLVLQDAALLDSNTKKSLLQFAEIRLDFGLIDALLRGAPVPRNITIVGATLHVERRPDGSIVVAGIDAGASESDTNQTPAVVLPQRLSLQDSKVVWDDRLLGKAPLHFHLSKAQLAHDGEHHQVDVDLGLPGGGGNVQLSVDITGALDNPNAWVAQFYVASEHLLLSTLPKQHQPEGYLLQQGVASFKLWGHWQAGEIDQLLGQFNLQKLQLSHQQNQENQENTQPQLLDVEHLASRIQWRRQDQGWRFDAAGIEFQQAGQATHKSNLSVISQNADLQPPILQIELDALELADVHAVASILPLPNGLSDALTGLQPQAEITAVKMDYEGATDTPKWHFTGQINNLQLQPWNDIPGVKNITARVEANQDHGALILDSVQAEVDFKGLFRAPLPLQQLTGLLQWEQLPDVGWRLHSNELIAKNSDIATRTRLLMDIPSAPDQSIFLDLQTDFANGTASSTHRYLPAGIMGEEVVKWLDRALVSGHVTSGSCVVRGHLRDFPYNNNKGRFEVLFGVEDLVLDYFPGWPRLEEVSTEVRFLDDSFDAWIVDGKILNSEIKQAHGWIDQLSESTPFKLDGKVYGALNDDLRLLRESPLAEDFAATVEGMRAEGNAQVEVNFAIPLTDTDPQPFRIDGKVGFKKSTLHLDDWQLSLTKMKGDLLFDEEGIRAKGILAETLNTAVNVDLERSPTMPDATRVTARAHLPMATLANRFPDMGLDILDGATNWTLKLDIPNKVAQSDAAALISAESDLIGIAIDLPAPLGKTAIESRHLQLSTSFSKQPLRPLQGRYGDILDLSLLLDASNPAALTLQRGELRLGGAQAILPDSEGLRLHARLDEFDITPWLEQFSTLDSTADTTDKLPISAVDLNIHQLQKDELTLDDVSVKLKHEDGIWSGPVATSFFDGKLTIPSNIPQEAITLRLNQIEFNFKPKEDEETAEQPQSKSIVISEEFLDPRDFPALYLQSDKVILNGQDLGSIILDVRKVDGGLSLEPTLMESERLALELSGHWIKTSHAPESHLEFALDAPEVGDLLADMDITHNIQDSSAIIRGNLNWQGGPHLISMQGITGRLKVKIGKGSILEVDPGIGRVFGLLNLTALQRRLSLDFSDLYEKGFGFDRMRGTFKLQDGNADTDKFEIDGPAAKIILSGRTGLVTHDLDQHIIVAPQITSSVTLATTIANPAAGAALFLAQNIMGKELDKITSYHYQVTGTWDEPQFSEKKSVFLEPLQDALSPKEQSQRIEDYD